MGVRRARPKSRHTMQPGTSFSLFLLVAAAAAFETSDMTASTNRHSHSPVAKPKAAENEGAVVANDDNKTAKDEVKEAAATYRTHRSPLTISLPFAGRP